MNSALLVALDRLTFEHDECASEWWRRFDAFMELHRVQFHETREQDWQVD